MLSFFFSLLLAGGAVMTLLFELLQPELSKAVSIIKIIT